jgi:hypothetical protein
MKKCQECNETRNAEKLYDTKICENCKHFETFKKLNNLKPCNIKARKNRLERDSTDISLLVPSLKEDDDFLPK